MKIKNKNKKKKKKEKANQNSKQNKQTAQSAGKQENCSKRGKTSKLLKSAGKRGPSSRDCFALHLVG